MVIHDKKLYILAFVFLALNMHQYTYAASILDYCTFTNAKELSKDALTAYGLALGLSLLHELGHALPAKFLLNSPIDIEIGPQCSDPIMALPFFKINSINPLKGAVAHIKWPLTPRKPMSEIVTCLVGPTVGILASFTSFLLLAVYRPGLMVNTIAKSLCLLKIITNAANFLPVDIDEEFCSDGGRAKRIYQQYYS